jgi:hypothetical protein
VLVLAFKFAAKMVDVELQLERTAAGMHRGRYRAMFHEGISRHG